ncbi:lysosomal Pro-X carboxypeptidase-like [Anthonomus grandis grandis]|uniref:lysosomal Pro-X carboxypeptidase-like n=1 Tax=Anthonomus grandis grandis TaxID=2921223 RepID=UPI0021662BB4|nr:lysosomal Pro-X carboxypeptidase-like [Anthonomus grandis grandis]
MRNNSIITKMFWFASNFLWVLFPICMGEQYGYVTKYIDMPLDHFSFTSSVTFKLRYLVNDTYYNDENPIFFYTGNEGDITMFAQNTGFMYDLGKKMNALLVFAEHRFYGETLPFGNESYNSPEKLGYLSAQQALADYVYLIDDLQKQYVKNGSSLTKLPVIAFGGSYGGMLSAYLRMKYPYSVEGAIASSAPIWSLSGLVPCGSFNKILTDVVRTQGSERCVDTIKSSWSAIRSTGTTDAGRATLTEEFRLCSKLNSSSDVNDLVDWISEIYGNLVMVNYPYPTDFLAPLPGHPVKEMCSQIDSVDDPVTAVAKGLKIYTNYTKSVKCNDLNATALPSLGESGWNFQTCTDMVMPMCSTDEDLFENAPWNFEEFSLNCDVMFKVRPRSERVAILEFGGKLIDSASNIVFSNGLLDPWSSGGVMTNVSSQIFAVLIPDAAHHADLRGENPLDSGSVRSAREFHANQISKWVDKFYFKRLPLEAYYEKHASFFKF